MNPIGTNTPLDWLSPIHNNSPRKVPNKHTDPLQAANPGPLSQADKPVGGGEGPQADARRAAEGLVSTSFIEPILKQTRESNNAPPPFGPSNVEKQFGALLDSRLADDIVHAANFPLVDRIAEELTRNMPASESTAQTPRIDIDA